MPIEFYSPVSGGAIATILMQTARCLQRMGHHVTVATGVDGHPTYDVGEVIPLHFCRREDLTGWRRKASTLQGRAFGWDWPAYEYYRDALRRFLARSAGFDLLCAFNDLQILSDVRTIMPKARRAVWLQNECRSHSRWAGRKIADIDHLLCCSDYIAGWTASYYGLDRAKLNVVTSGVDLHAFTPRSNLAPAGALKVLALGRIDRNKGPDIAADAVAMLKETGADIEFTCAGGLWFYARGDETRDPYLLALRDKVRSIGGKWLGHVPPAQTRELIRNHDVVCVLSRSNEPFGLVALEAMAGGCAVIASNRGGLPQACGDAAILVDPDDAQSVQHALRRLATDPAWLMERKRASLARAANASWEKTAAAVESIFSRQACQNR